MMLCSVATAESFDGVEARGEEVRAPSVLPQ